jgi:hypothetical protein
MKTYNTIHSGEKNFTKEDSSKRNAPVILSAGLQ